MRFISVFIYDFIIRLYGQGIAFAALFNQKARIWITGRRQQQIIINKPAGSKTIWFHCASLGEFEQARPVIEGIKESSKNFYIVLTFFSPSGYEVRKQYEFADKVFYLPLDSTANALNFIESVKPDVALFAKYEFWFHYLDELHKKGIPTILFSAVFRKEQAFFQWYGGLFREMLTKFSTIFVQDEASKKLLGSISIPCNVAFDTRFDRVNQAAQNRKLFPAVEKFKGNSKIFIAGSTWPKDEEIITQLINDDALPGYKYILAPHDVSGQRISSLQSNCRKQTVLFSALNENNAAGAEVLIVDNIGSLLSLYGYGDVAYIGGGFDAGIHNVLEAAVYGLPVLFGPRYTKFIEARELLACRGAMSISSSTQLLKKLKLILQNQHYDNTSPGKKAAAYVQSHLGGALKVMKAVSPR